MISEATNLAATALNIGLQQRYESGDPLHLEVMGSPELHILSFSPLAYREYGNFRNRAPQISGTFALRGILVRPHPYDTGALFYGGIETGREAYGILFHDLRLLSQIATDLGHTDFEVGPGV